MCTGAKDQKRALSARLQDNDIDKLESRALTSLLLPEYIFNSLWSLLVTLVFSQLHLFVDVLKIILTDTPAYMLNGKKLKCMS